VQDLLVFLVRGCNFDGMAPKREQNHNCLWKRPPRRRLLTSDVDAAESGLIGS
jgi:hypothetical protein